MGNVVGKLTGADAQAKAMRAAAEAQARATERSAKLARDQQAQEAAAARQAAQQSKEQELLREQQQRALEEQMASQEGELEEVDVEAGDTTTGTRKRKQFYETGSQGAGLNI